MTHQKRCSMLDRSILAIAARSGGLPISSPSPCFWSWKTCTPETIFSNIWHLTISILQSTIVMPRCVWQVNMTVHYCDASMCDRWIWVHFCGTMMCVTSEYDSPLLWHHNVCDKWIWQSTIVMPRCMWQVNMTVHYCDATICVTSEYDSPLLWRHGVCDKWMWQSTIVMPWCVWQVNVTVHYCDATMCVTSECDSPLLWCHDVCDKWMWQSTIVMPWCVWQVNMTVHYCDAMVCVTSEYDSPLLRPWWRLLFKLFLCTIICYVEAHVVYCL